MDYKKEYEKRKDKEKKEAIKKKGECINCNRLLICEWIFETRINKYNCGKHKELI